MHTIDNRLKNHSSTEETTPPSAEPPKIQISASKIKIPADMVPAIRSDHAGEVGAVCIYRGILAVSNETALCDFAHHHLATEQRHLKLMEEILPSEQHSRLLPLWRVAGWFTGALPALFGAAAVYRTIGAVESYVDLHYARQIDVLRGRSADEPLYNLLEACQSDEVMHRDDALSRLGKPSLVGKAWTKMVSLGSGAGVYLASRL